MFYGDRVFKRMGLEEKSALKKNSAQKKKYVQEKMLHRESQKCKKLPQNTEGGGKSKYGGGNRSMPRCSPQDRRQDRKNADKTGGALHKDHKVFRRQE